MSSYEPDEGVPPVPDPNDEYEDHHGPGSEKGETLPVDPSPVPGSEDETTTPTPSLVAYKVTARQRVDEVKRGGILYLDPDEPRTARLLERGQIVRVDTTQED